MWLSFWKAVSQISIWLVKKVAFTIHYSLICLVRQKYGWKGNCFDRWMKTLKCGWHPPDRGELALMIKLNHTNISLLLWEATQKYCKVTDYWTKCCYLSLSPSLCLLQLALPLPSEFIQFFKHHKWSFLKYIVSFFWFENGFLQVKPSLIITSCINSHVYSNFNLHCLMSYLLHTHFFTRKPFFCLSLNFLNITLDFLNIFSWIFIFCFLEFFIWLALTLTRNIIFSIMETQKNFK